MSSSRTDLHLFEDTGRSTHPRVLDFKFNLVFEEMPTVLDRREQVPGYSTKVFFQLDTHRIKKCDLLQIFKTFGHLDCNHPHVSLMNLSPHGNLFFQDESSVNKLVESCVFRYNKRYLPVSFIDNTMKYILIETWKRENADYTFDNIELDIRKTVFVDKISQSLSAFQFGSQMNIMFGGVSRVKIYTDHYYKYPKGYGAITFNNNDSYIMALKIKNVIFQMDNDIHIVFVEPFVQKNHVCDYCLKETSVMMCTNICCLKYYCLECWDPAHQVLGADYEQHVKFYLHQQFINFNSRN